MAKAAKKNTASVRAAMAGSGDVMTVAQKISWWSLLAMVFIVPIAMSNWTFLGFHLPISYDQFDITKVFFQRVLGLIALSAWGWDILKRGGKIRRTPVDWLILVFLGWVALSMFFSISPATAFFGKYRRFEGLLSFINYAVIYFLVLQFADRPSRVRTLAETLFWSSFIVAGYGLLQSIGRDPIDWHSLPFEQFRPFSTYGNPDLLGGFLMFSLPIALALALAEEDNMWVRLIYWAGFGINAIVWIVSFTRGAWIGGAVGIILMGIVAWRHHTKLGPVDLVPVGVTAAYGGYKIFKSMSNTNEVMNFGARFSSIFKTGEGSGLTRTEIWTAAIRAITASPWRFIVGYGADTFRLVFPRYKPIEYTRDAGYLSVADNVHDYPLQLATGIGVVGVLLMYSIFAWAAVRSFKLVFGESDDRNRLLIGGFWVAAAAYLTQLMFGLSVTGNTFLLWVCIGVVLAPTATFVEFTAPDWGIAAASAGIVLALVGIGYQFVFMAADWQYLQANAVLSGSAATQAAIKAAQLNPWNDMYSAEIGMSYRNEFVDLINSAYQAKQAGQDSTQYSAQAVEKFNAAATALKATIAMVPDEYDNYVFISSLYNIGGSALNPQYFADAIYWSQRGIAVEPYGPAIRVQYARALIGTGKNAEALKQLQYAWSMDQAYVEAGETLAQQYKDMGRPADAIATLKVLLGTAPGDTTVAPMLKQFESSSTATTP
ncbi:MAG: O-antigen ligase family protein [Coriobacteriia bacterium]|nr:O-antigen ligase family protein [Coriobacteriia bacterium]